MGEPTTGRTVKAEPEVRFCRQCRGTISLAEARLPYGWYQVTVGVPDYMESIQGRGYLWIGMYCSAACLAANASYIQSQETLARQAYEPEVPS